MVKYLSTLLNKYFNILKYFGYKRYISVDKILVVSFIQETIDEDMCYVSDEDKLLNVLRDLEELYIINKKVYLEIDLNPSRI